MPRRSDRRGLHLPPSAGDMPPRWVESWVGRYMRGVYASEDPQPLDRETAERYVARMWRSMPPDARAAAWRLEQKIQTTRRSSTR